MTSSSQLRRSRREALEEHRITKAKKDRRNKILFVAAGVFIVLAVIGTSIWGILSSMSQSGTEYPPNAVDRHGIALGAMVNELPTIEVFSDYNCSACRSAHFTLSPTLEEAVKQGKANVVIIPVNFQGGTSRYATQAVACSDFQGVFSAFDNELFTRAGEELTEEAIRNDIPEAVGLTGEALTNFQTCLDTGATGGFVDSTSAYASKQGVLNTPSIRLDSKLINEDLFNKNTNTYDPDKLRAILGMS